MDYIGEQQTTKIETIRTTKAPITFRERVEKSSDIREITREKLLIFLQSLNGKIVTVDFIKKNGVFRTLNGRLGVKCHADGKPSDIHRMDSPYICVYEMPKPNTGIAGGYRYVNIHTIISIRANHQNIFVN